MTILSHALPFVLLLGASSFAAADAPRARPSGAASQHEVDAALALLASPNFKVRAQATLALGAQSRHSLRVARPLVGMLGDAHPAVRVAAAMALGKLGDVTTVPALVPLFDGDDRSLADVARRSTERIVAAFLAAPERFADRPKAVHVARLGQDPHFKDRVVERLLAKDIEVGERFDFVAPDEAATPLGVQLELIGELVSLSDDRGTLRVTLALRPGGATLTQWTNLNVVGTSRDDVLDAAATLLVKTLLAYLGGS
ncbi:MAG: HEAT repeat domain-containing protein [Myxococcales bacterium]|nr:HEAT repeat domain-containing protein [Myxococcales bacterium]